METKKCPACREIKLANQYNWNSNRDRLRTYCKECETIKSTLYNREHRKRNRHGITNERWDEMFKRQERRCALCRTDDPGSKTGWHTDHDYETNVVRGILCLPCNQALGHYEKLLKNPRLKEYLAKGISQLAAE